MFIQKYAPFLIHFSFYFSHIGIMHVCMNKGLQIRQLYIYFFTNEYFLNMS